MKSLHFIELMVTFLGGGILLPFINSILIRKRATSEWLRDRRLESYKVLMFDLDELRKAVINKDEEYSNKSFKSHVRDLNLLSPPLRVKFAVQDLIIRTNHFKYDDFERRFLLPKYFGITDDIERVILLINRDMADLIKSPSIVERFSRYRDEEIRYSWNPIFWLESLLYQRPFLTIMIVIEVILIVLLILKEETII